MNNSKELLNAFLGEGNSKNSDLFLGTDFRLTTEQQIGSETKLENSEIEEIEEAKQEKFFSSNSPLRTSIQFQQNGDYSPIQTQQQFYNSDNIFIDFLDILKVQGIEEPCLQYYFNQIFKALLAFKPETVQSLTLEKHKNEHLFHYIYKYIGDFDIADFIEKTCFQLYEPSENISTEYLKEQESSVIQIIEELLDMVTVDADEFDLKSICRIFKNCLLKRTSHHYSRNFIKFSNLMFTPPRVKNYINILVNSKRTLAVCEMAELLISALKIIQHHPQQQLDAEPKMNNQVQFQEQFDREWIDAIVNSLAKIKAQRLDEVDRKRTIVTQFEETIQIFGNEKLSIIDLVFELVKLNDPYVNNEIMMQDFPQKFLSYLFEYDWNNLLHEKIFTMVDFLVSTAIEQSKQISFQTTKEPNYIILMHLVTQVEIYKEIRKRSSDDTITLQVKKIQMKRPNMAFIIKIADSLERLRQQIPEINDTFEELQRQKWIDFCQTFLKKNLDIQKINLGENDSRKEMIQDNTFGGTRQIKQSKNSSKLTERFRKNSGKELSLFIHNPSNKKFSTTITAVETSQQKSEIIYEKNQEANAQSPSQKVQSARIQRKKFINICDEEKEKDDDSLCLSRKKVSISVERKSASSIQQGNSNYTNNLSIDNSQEKENDVKLVQQSQQQENQSAPITQTRKQSDILDHLDDLWETSTKRIITLGSSNSKGIVYDEAQTSKNKANQQISKSNHEILLNEERDRDSIMFKRKSENNQTQVSSFGAKLMENLNIKKKKFSYDEQNTAQFLMSPRIFHKKKRVKSLPNLHSTSLFSLEDEVEMTSEDNEKQGEQSLKREENFSIIFSSSEILTKEKFSNIKIQSITSIEHRLSDTDSSPSKSPMLLHSCGSTGPSPSKKQNRSLILKQSNSLKESYFDENKRNEAEPEDSFKRILTQTRKINLTTIPGKQLQIKKLQQKSQKISVETNAFITKINEEENDSQSETEMNNSHSNSKSDSSSSDLQKTEKEIPIELQLSNNPENFENAEKMNDDKIENYNESEEQEEENSDVFWLLKPKSDSQSMFREIETRESSISCFIAEKKQSRLQQCDDSPNKSSSISDFFSTQMKGFDPKIEDLGSQKIEESIPNYSHTRRRKESIFDNSYLSPICQVINRDDTESCINNDDDESYEQSASSLSQRLSMSKSSTLQNYNQESQEYSFGGHIQQQAKITAAQKDYNQQSFFQNDTTSSLTMENDKSKQIDNSINQDNSFLL